jgi:hypothetical protein
MSDNALVFSVDGESMYPRYIQKINYSVEPVWSSNTRRNASGKMTGKIITNKAKLEISYAPNLPQEYLAQIKSKALSNQEWHSVHYTDETGERVTKTMYFGTGYSVEPRLFVDGKMLYQSISISLIER